MYRTGRGAVNSNKCLSESAVSPVLMTVTIKKERTFRKWKAHKLQLQYLVMQVKKQFTGTLVVDRQKKGKGMRSGCIVSKVAKQRRGG